MQYRRLGANGPVVSTVAMGCWAIAGGGNWGPQDEGEAMGAITTALDLGITLFDTAEGYGESETLLGRGLAGRRDEAIIASKVSGGHLHPDEVVAACEHSLRCLQTDRIDLYQIHWPSREVPLDETMAALVRLKEAGKILQIGVSNFGPQDLADLAATHVPCISNQVHYNLLTRAIEFAVLPDCRAAGIGILAYSPLAQGLLSGKFPNLDAVPPGRARSRHFAGTRLEARHGESGFEAETMAAMEGFKAVCARHDLPPGETALAWCLHQEGVTAVLAGARSPAQVRENAAASDRVLAPEVVTELSAATETLKQSLGPSLDLWQSVANSRSR